MRKFNKKIIAILIMFFILLILEVNAFANSLEDLVQPVEFSEEFEKYMQLSDEEKSKVLMPKTFQVLQSKVKYTNPIKIISTRANVLETEYSLKSYIPENIIVRNQEQTNTCWAFASISSLETNLALNNYYNEAQAKPYDFSERHMAYAVSRLFLNGVRNENSYNTSVSEGGTFDMANTYLTNGRGAIDENDMPFVNSEETIDIKQIQNKNVTSQVLDTIDFATEDNEQLMQQIKQHIKEHGAIAATAHGVDLLGSDYYNNETGAVYCSNRAYCPIDHAVSIIGWDDNYSINNFNEKHRPQNPGAWIVKNSWGEKYERDLAELKEEIFEEMKQQWLDFGYTNASMIPDQVITQAGYTIEDGKASIKVGKDGFWYISYEDVNIYDQLSGIVKAQDFVDYENIYQYDYLGQNYSISVQSPKVYLGTIFNRKDNNKEYITQVGIYAPEAYTCKVYINANNSSKNKDDLKLVQLKAGESETFDTAGYHTLEFLKPVKLTGDDFFVAIEIQGSQTDKVRISAESQIPGTMYDDVETESGKCFFTTDGAIEGNFWQDTSSITTTSNKTVSLDTTIKVFTTSNVVDDSLKSIKIITPPHKTHYFVGDDFDDTGMVVQAEYNDGSTRTLESYNIKNGTNLQENQENVIISFQDGDITKETTQEITVEKNVVTKLTIKQPPTKTEYIEGDSFDPSGMVIEASYKNGTNKVIKDYQVEDGENLTKERTSVTISYENQSVTQNITVAENNIVKIEITKKPNKTTYIEGQDFEKNGMVVVVTYKNGTKEELNNYTIVNGTNLNIEQTSVEIRYGDMTATQPINVEEKAIVSIEVSKRPDKIKYIQNKEQLNTAGGIIKVNYNNGTSENISMDNENVTITGFSNENLGNVNITVTYKTKVTQFEIEIIQDENVNPGEEEPEDPDKGDTDQGDPDQGNTGNEDPDQGDTDKGDPDNKVYAKSSDLKNAKCDVKAIKIHMPENETSNYYAIIDVEVNNISINYENDSYKYYYYISPNQGEGDKIQNWIEIDKINNKNNLLVFSINTDDVKNYKELLDLNSIYLYVKEVVKKGGDQSVAISCEMLMDSDDSKIEINGNNNNANNSNTNQGNKNPSNNGDKTIATNKLPYTGLKMTLLISVVIIGLCGIVLYIRYKNLNKYVK